MLKIAIFASILNGILVATVPVFREHGMEFAIFSFIFWFLAGWLTPSN